MNTEQWLDRWLGSRVVGPKTLERYERAVESLKKSLMFIDISEINPELVEKICGEDPSLRSVLSMALGEAVKASLLKSNPAVIKREQRSPKEGSLFYRANRKAWVAQVTRLGPDGKRVQNVKYIKVEKKTKNPPDAAIRALEELKQTEFGSILVKGKSTVSELMTEWLASIRVQNIGGGEGLARTTFEQYESLARHQVIPWIGNIRVKDLDRVRVDKWLKDLEATAYVLPSGKTRTYSANTIRLSRVVLGKALQWAMREGVVSRNVVKESSPAGGRSRPEKNAMSEDQARQLIEATRGSDLGALWALMITTGLRRGEALGLRWQDYDGESITVTSQLKLEGGKVVRGDLKTDKSRRRLKLPDFLVTDLEDHRRTQLESAARDGRKSPELIFINSNGGPIRPDNLNKRFASACKKAGIGPHEDGRAWSVHELRHTAASQLLSNRVPMQIVSRTLGHSSITVTLDVYSHLSDSDSESVADAMENMYGKKVSEK